MYADLIWSVDGRIYCRLKSRLVDRPSGTLLTVNTFRNAGVQWGRIGTASGPALR